MDEILAKELILYAENNQFLYKRFQNWVVSFNTKKRRQRYVHALAIQGLANNYVPEIIRTYNKEVAKLPNVDRETKLFVANYFVNYYEENVEDYKHLQNYSDIK